MASKDHVGITPPAASSNGSRKEGAGPRATKPKHRRASRPDQVPIIPVKDPPDPAPKTIRVAPIAAAKPVKATPKASSAGAPGTRNRAR